MPSKLIFSTKEAAAWLGMGVYYFRSFVKKGEIRIKRNSNSNHWLFTKAELERFAEEREIVSGEERDGTDE